MEKNRPAPPMSHHQSNPGSEQSRRAYTTELSKGQGMVDETLALLDLWEPGITVVQLKKKAVESGILGRSTAIRVEDIVGRVFAKRYLQGKNPPINQLKLLLKLGVPQRALNQVLLLFTARVHDVLFDFVTQVYWRKFAAGATEICRDDALDFLYTAAANGVLAPPWSEVMMIRVARYLTGCLTEFQLAGPDRQGRRPLLPFRLGDLTALFLAHDLHFAGMSDRSILEHPDWGLFGLEMTDVQRELRRLGRNHFLVQISGDLVRITWHYDTFEEALRGIAAAEFQ